MSKTVFKKKKEKKKTYDSICAFADTSHSYTRLMTLAVFGLKAPFTCGNYLAALRLHVGSTESVQELHESHWSFCQKSSGGGSRICIISLDVSSSLSVASPTKDFLPHPCYKTD